jgi:hypothetical protein
MGLLRYRLWLGVSGGMCFGVRSVVCLLGPLEPWPLVLAGHERAFREFRHLLGGFGTISSGNGDALLLSARSVAEVSGP